MCTFVETELNKNASFHHVMKRLKYLQIILNQRIMALVWISSRDESKMWTDALNSISKQSGLFSIVQHEAISSSRDGVIDARVSIRLSDGNVRVLGVQRRSRLLPSEAFGLGGLLSVPAGFDASVISCPFVSPRVGEICDRANINYFDDSGNARIKLPGCFIKIAGNPNMRPSVQKPRDLFAPRSSRIVRMLLEKPEHSWTLQELTKAAQVSIGLASRISTALTEDGYLFTLGSVMRLHDPEALLKQWAKVYRGSNERLDVFVMEKNVEDVERRMAQFCQRHFIQYALAEFSGAWQIAPAVKYSRATIAVAQPTLIDLKERLMEEYEGQPVQSGSNVTFICAADPFDLFGMWTLNTFPVLSPIELYIQLRSNPARGEDAAEAILQKIIRPRFEAAKSK